MDDANCRDIDAECMQTQLSGAAGDDDGQETVLGERCRAFFTSPPPVVLICTDKVRATPKSIRSVLVHEMQHAADVRDSHAVQKRCLPRVWEVPLDFLLVFLRGSFFRRSTLVLDWI